MVECASPNSGSSAGFDKSLWARRYGSSYFCFPQHRQGDLRWERITGLQWFRETEPGRK